jgi:hypothetical protein
MVRRGRQASSRAFSSPLTAIRRAWNDLVAGCNGFPRRPADRSLDNRSQIAGRLDWCLATAANDGRSDRSRFSLFTQCPQHRCDICLVPGIDDVPGSEPIDWSKRISSGAS